MKILAHRGIWHTAHERNTLPALENALRLGFGIETDIRDCDGELVISHDAPLKLDSLRLDDFLQLCSNYGNKSLLALNIKSDGLQQQLKSKLDKYSITNYFVFDMSVPDTLGYMKLGMPFATRLSEFETGDRFLSTSRYIWLDAFEGEWYSTELISDFLSQGKDVVVVSPELHKRPHLDLWNKLGNIKNMEHLYLCTDFISQALGVFNVEQN